VSATGFRVTAIGGAAVVVVAVSRLVGASTSVRGVADIVRALVIVVAVRVVGAGSPWGRFIFTALQRVAGVRGTDVAIVTVNDLIGALTSVIAKVIGASVVVLAVLQVIDATAQFWVTVVASGAGVVIIAILGTGVAFTRLRCAAFADTWIGRNGVALLEGEFTARSRNATVCCTEVLVNAGDDFVNTLTVKAVISSARIPVVADNGCIDALPGD
jgi:hypothetical protein